MAKVKKAKQDEDFEEDSEEVEEEEEDLEEEIKSKKKQSTAKVYTREEMKTLYSAELKRIEEEEMQEKFLKEIPNIQIDLQQIRKNLLEVNEFKKQVEVAIDSIKNWIKQMHPIIEELNSKKKK